MRLHRKKIIIAVLVFLFTGLSVSKSFATVAEASMVPPQDYIHLYDISDLSKEEKKWFVTFIEGTFYADGWQEITGYILRNLPYEEQKPKQQQLSELGYKIGREWCKDNSIRKIDTAMLKKWGRLLKSAAQDDPNLLEQVLEDIHGEVDTLID